MAEWGTIDQCYMCRKECKKPPIAGNAELDKCFDPDSERDHIWPRNNTIWYGLVRHGFEW